MDFLESAGAGGLMEHGRAGASQSFRQPLAYPRDHFRKPGNRLRIVDVDEAADLPDPGAAAEEVVSRKEMNACIRQVIDSLPESYRAPLILHDLEGLSVAETAAICEAPVPATKIRIHRARKRLEEALRAQCDLYSDSRNVLRCDRVP